MLCVDRTKPPADIRRALRVEVGFGCPVDGCGSPYLTWHHFDPPWRERQHHDADGMIALCLQHHKEADSGAFSHEQLRVLKASPFLKRARVGPAGHFNWKREQLILNAGGSLFVRCPVFLAVGGRPIVWLSSDQNGNQLLNLDIWDTSGQLILSMRDNDWLVVADLDDVEAPPSARSLVVRDSSRDIRASIKFSTATLDQILDDRRTHEQEATAQRAAQVRKELDRKIKAGAPDQDIAWYRMLANDSHGLNDDQAAERAASLTASIRREWPGEEFVVCSFQARIPFPYKVDVTASKITLPGQNTISGMTAIDCGTAIMLG